MAKKSSTDGGIIIIGLIVFAMVAKYWYLFVTVSITALIVWGIVKLAKNWSSPEKIHIGTSKYQTDSSPHSQFIHGNSTQGADVQQPKSTSPDTLWVPCGRTIQHAGYTIPGGLIYFGNGLKSVTHWGEEPSLIDSSLPVFSDNPDREGRNMGYWPSYTQIHPTSRAAYLNGFPPAEKTQKPISAMYSFTSTAWRGGDWPMPEIPLQHETMCPR